MIKRLLIIPARSGSKRIKNKNIKNFLGRPIIEYPLSEAIKSNLFNKIHISIANQVLSMNNEKWYTIPKAYKDSDDLKAKFENENDFEKLTQLKKFDLLIDQIQSNFQ